MHYIHNLGEVFDCGVLEDPENGSVDLSDGTTEGSTATYTCFAGYQLKGVATRTCIRSGWSDKEPTCERKKTLTPDDSSKFLLFSSFTSFFFFFSVLSSGELWYFGFS